MPQQKRKTTRKPASSKKTAAKRPTKAQVEEMRRHRQQLWAVVLFAVGILFAALTLISGQNVWKFCHDAVFGLFGACAFLIAPLMIYIAVLASLDRPFHAIGVKVVQAFLLLILISSAIQIFGSAEITGQNFFEQVASLYTNGVKLRGGGVAAGLVAWPLSSLFGNLGAGITIVLLIFVFLMIFTGFTLIDLFRSVSKPVKQLETTYIEQAQAHKEARAAREARFNIDVDLGPDSQKQRVAKTVPAEMPIPLDVPHEEEKEQSPKRQFFGIFGAKEPKVQSQPTPAEQPAPRIEFDKMVSTTPKNGQPLPTPEPEEPVSVKDLFTPIEVMATEAPEEFPTKEEEKNPLEKELSVILPHEQQAEFDEAIDRAIKNYQDAVREEQAQRDLSLAQKVGIPEQEDLEDEPLRDFISSEEPIGQPVKETPLQQTPESLTQEDPKPPVAEEYGPPITLLNEPSASSQGDMSDEIKKGDRLVETLKSFGVQTKIINISKGPAVTRFELQPSAGVKISKITGLADDIALNLAAAGVRIEAPIPNKAAVGIEIPNRVQSMVSIREIIDSNEFVDAKSNLTIALGRDIAGKVVVADIAKMPHLLIAGATGSGKSVCINSILMSLIYKSSPEDVKLLMVDPKVVELGIYNGIPHLLVPVVTDPRKAAGTLNWAVTQMLERYKLFADNAVRDIRGFNELAERTEGMQKMPQIVIIIDELADLMMAAPNEVEDAICRLAQMARAAGMHLVIATQRPSVDVITGVIKANIPSRIAFAVSSQVDSRTILDSGGAEKLLGKGDMLFYPMGSSKPQRVQGCFVSDKEIERVVDYIKQTKTAEYDEDVISEIDRLAVKEKGKGDSSGGGFDEVDDMLPQAIELVVEAGQASTSMLQRRLRLGYARAARLVDEMEQRGIVGPSEGGGKPRQVLMTKQQWMEMNLSQEE